MGQLTGYLQDQFHLHCPAGWECRPEAPVMNPELEAILGYAPRSDIVLANQSDGRRLWIEFEVSRADPVANHAKFATAHVFQPQAPHDIFVSMVSRHVDRGRRNLAANTILVMRKIGMNAVQTVLFPILSGNEVQRFNHMKPEDLRTGGPEVQPEIERVFAVSTPQGTADGHRIFFAGDIVDVLLNARMWNEGVATPSGRSPWRQRRIQYFVYVPFSREFAPSKFCAFLPIPLVTELPQRVAPSHMTLELYAALDEEEPRFDGHAAQRHLTRRLGMLTHTPDSHPKAAADFHRWIERMADLIQVSSSGPVFLVPPWR
jgi:hypothetical protein